MRYITLLLTLPIAATNAATIPSRFEADRVFATPTTTKGETLWLYTDTGGGMNLLCRKTAERLHLPLEAMPANEEMEAELGGHLARTMLPSFKPAEAIPANMDGDSGFLVHDCKGMGQASSESFGDGLLSQHWFAGRIWTWDYPAQRLSLQGAAWTPPRGARSTPLGFKAATAGNPAFHMPRIGVRIDGKVIDLLLDTGASGFPTKEALAAQPSPTPVNGARATSFITRSTLDAWRVAHPDWMVIEKADELFALAVTTRAIRVPQVEIAGWQVGPVWFTERPDAAFRSMMSTMTDRPVEGALGGNAFAHFRMTLDYARAKAHFECLRDCGITPRPAP